MISSAVRTFTYPDDYAAAIRQGTTELTVTRRGDFTAKLTRIDLHRVWMQRFWENLPRVSHVAGWGGRAVIAFRTHPGPGLLRSGVQMDPGILMDVNFIEMHNPTNAAPEFAGKSHLGDYSDSLMELDADIGRVMAAIRAQAPRMIWFRICSSPTTRCPC